jgi:hypothetical protein
MAKNKHRQLAIVRRLRGPRKIRTRIGVRAPLLFAVLVIIAMVLDMCAFPPSRRNVVLAQTCAPAQIQWVKGKQVAKTAPPVEKEDACQ